MDMLQRFRLLLLGALLTPLACDNPFEARAAEEIIVLGSLASCLAWPMIEYPCYLAVTLPRRDTTAFAMTQIRGFNFEEGVRHHLLIESLRLKNPPLDASDTEYRLLRVISRKVVARPLD